jgi:methyl-accepting chemotaxis protein
MVKRNSEDSTQAATLSKGSRESADSGEVEIKKLLTAMEEINQSSKKIEDIINVIDDIAFQTNLLALNAAVEAARAGEQGKGFAVVAEEVRNLAQRSAAAAKDITALIEENVRKIESGVTIAEQGGNALRNIVSSVRKVADLNNEIASASKEQSSGLEQISKAMNQLDQITQSNAASAEEVASSSEQMSSQGIAMQETVEKLKVLVYGTLNPFAGAANFNLSSLKSHLASPENVIPIRPKYTAQNQYQAEKVIPFESKEENTKIGNLKGF